MLPKLTKSGIVVVTIGAIIFVVGLVLFLSFFFWATNEMNSPMHTRPFQPSFLDSSPFDRPVPFQNAVIGVILTGLGGFMVKVGLGFTLAGSSGKIVNWFGHLIHEAGSQGQCPTCNTTNRRDARFCSNCGTPLESPPREGARLD